MKLNIGLIRKFTNEISSIDEELINQVLTERKSDLPNEKSNLLEKIKNFDTDDLKTAEFRNLWRLAEFSILLGNWTSLYKTSEDISNFNLKSFTGDNSTEYTKSNRFQLLELLKKPKIIVLINYTSNQRTLRDKASVNDHFTDRIFAFPDDQIIFTKSNSDQNEIFSLLEGNFGVITPVRTKTMNISKLYSQELMITSLTVAAKHEITGFSGFDQIKFEGDHVKEGLYGLHKRQDIRVNMDQIGPRIGISTSDLDLKIGPKVRLLSLKGIEVLKKYVIE
jgi:hypothetical protein